MWIATRQTHHAQHSFKAASVSQAYSNPVVHHTYDMYKRDIMMNINMNSIGQALIYLSRGSIEFKIRMD